MSDCFDERATFKGRIDAVPFCVVIYENLQSELAEKILKKREKTAIISTGCPKWEDVCG